MQQQATETILQKIIADKHSEVRARKESESLQTIRNRANQTLQSSPPRDFLGALKDKSRLPVIAEIKHKSPSAGVLRESENFNPATIAQQYQNSKAACLSVLTDAPYFGGDASHLQAARAATDLPVLRKDFMIDPWQIYESRTMGADAILLLASVLSVDEMRTFANIAADLSMTSLLEVHNESETHAALTAVKNSDAKNIIGINNRDLSSFAVSLEVSLQLLPLITQSNFFAVSESGIRTNADIKQLQQAGANGFLIGGALMQSSDAGAALAALFN